MTPVLPVVGQVGDRIRGQSTVSGVVHSESEVPCESHFPIRDGNFPYIRFTERTGIYG